MTKAQPVKNFKEWLSRKAKEHLDRADNFRRSKIPALKGQAVELVEALDVGDVELISQRYSELSWTFHEMYDWSPNSPLCKATGFHKTIEAGQPNTPNGSSVKGHP